MTVHEEYAAYLVSETGVFLGIIYLIVAVIFWKYQTKTITTEKPYNVV